MRIAMTSRWMGTVLALVLGLLLLVMFTRAQESQTGGAGGQGLQQQMQAGGEVYVQAGCIGCHGSEGQGQSGLGPALAGDQRIQNAELQISQILHGGGGMPAFADRLSDEQIAAVATYERNSWGNDFGQIKPQQVAALRSGQQPGGQTGGEQGGGQQIQVAQAFERDGMPQQHSQLTEPGQLYAENCASCHGAEGQGGQVVPGPALAGNQSVQDARSVVGILLTGSGKMPAYDYWLSEEQIAKVASYVRTSWDNAFGEVSAQEVAQIRQQVAPQERQQTGGAATGGAATGGAAPEGSSTGGSATGGTQ